MAQVHLDGMLREFVRVRTVEADGGTVRTVLEEIETKYPRLAGKIRDETGTVRRFVNVFVNGDNVRGLQGLETPVGTADRVDILHSIAGG